jgi:hypothetical protein
MLNRKSVAQFALATLGMTWSAYAHAQLTLTPTGSGLGFTLTTFASNFPVSGSVGPLGIAFNGSSVLVTDDPGNIRVFPTDMDGQNAASFAPTQNYGLGNAVGLSSAGGNFYMTRQTVGDLVQVNSNGTFNQVIVGGMPAATGMVTNPTNGHIFVSTLGNNAIWDVDPIAKTKVLFKSASADGLSTDGITLYGEVGNHILGWNILTGTQNFDSGLISGGPDGAQLGFGGLAGNIFVNTNDGHLIEVNLTTLTQTIIADSGSRGDFVTVDPNNGTLLITQTDRIMRLTPPSGSTFNGTPEPGTWAMLIGLSVSSSAVAFRRFRRKR